MDRTAFEAELQHEGRQVVVVTMQPGRRHAEHAGGSGTTYVAGRRKPD